ncbi:MAG: GH3 auxin-responsive promoter family protein [Myxococcota bacterium]|nr:GH3 auxin-responsive promoter family protein [Myxococcota bacterium]
MNDGSVGRRGLALLQRAWRVSLVPAAARFARAAADPARGQAAMLRRLLAANAGSRYGQQHGFGSIDCLATYRSRVPVVDGPALEPWIARIAGGEPGVLTREPVLLFERTAGSTAANKLVPYTAGLLAEFAAATNAWLYDLYQGRPGLLGRPTYWSVSPATRQPERTAGGVPIGLSDDTAYFGVLRGALLRRMLAVPPEVQRLADPEAWRRATVRGLLGCRALGLISVWSPTFLTELVDWLLPRWDELLAELPPPRQAELAALAPAARTGERIWPGLELVSCWADGASAAYLPRLQRLFPGVQLQPKGLLATEGVVTFPLLGVTGGVPAVTSHVLEFVDLDHPAAPPRGVHELQAGASYTPLLTTGGGLYRYALRDQVDCLGHHGRLPRLRFVGKLDRTSDLCGEKLAATVVGEALARACRECGVQPDFALVAPDDGPHPGYTVLVESPADDVVLGRLRDLLEQELARGAHYAYCRTLGQLDRLTVRRVDHGAQRFAQRLQAEGQRLGEIKPTPLDARAGWPAALAAGPPR